MEEQIDQGTTNAERAALAKKILAVSQACHHIGKDGHNRDQGYGYVSADAVMQAVGAAARACALVLSAEFERLTPPQETYSTKNGALWRFCSVRCILIVVDGDTGARWQPVTTYGDGTDPADKAPLKAMTAAHREALKKLFLITSKEDAQDPEADAETEREHPQRRDGSDNRIDPRDAGQQQQRPQRAQQSNGGQRPQQQRTEQQISHGRPVEQQRAPQAPPAPDEPLTGGREFAFTWGKPPGTPGVPIGKLSNAALDYYLHGMRRSREEEGNARWIPTIDKRIGWLETEIALRKNGRAA